MQRPMLLQRAAAGACAALLLASVIAHASSCEVGDTAILQWLVVCATERTPAAYTGRLDTTHTRQRAMAHHVSILPCTL